MNDEEFMRTDKFKDSHAGHRMRLEAAIDNLKFEILKAAEDACPLAIRIIEWLDIKHSCLVEEASRPFTVRSCSNCAKVVRSDEYPHLKCGVGGWYGRKCVANVYDSWELDTDVIPDDAAYVGEDWVKVIPDE